MTRYSDISTGADIGLVSFVLLAAAMICLKWAGLIGWSWWAVLSPIWGTVALYFLAFALIVYAAQRGDTT